MTATCAIVWLYHALCNHLLDIWVVSSFPPPLLIWAQGHFEADAGTTLFSVLGSQGLESLMHLLVGLLRLVIMALCGLMRTGLY